MRRAAVAVIAAALLLSCCVLATACNSLDDQTGAATSTDETLVDEGTSDPSGSDGESTDSTDSAASDQTLLGEWTQLSPAEGAGSTFEFFANGAVVQVSGTKVWNYTYTTTGGNLSFVNSAGVVEVSYPYTVAGDTMTMLNPNVTYVYARGGASIDQAILGVWTQISPAEMAGSTFEFFSDGRVVQVFGPDVWNYSFTTGGNNLSLINSEGVVEAAGAYSVAGNTLTFVNSRSGIVYEYRRD